MTSSPLYGVPVSLLAQLTGAHPTTARRWKRAARPPSWLARLVRLVVEGDLGEMSAAWRGWKLVSGELVSPEGWTATPGEVRALPLMHGQIAAYQAQLRLPAQGDWIEGRYARLPGALMRDAAPRPRATVAPISAAGAS